MPTIINVVEYRMWRCHLRITDLYRRHNCLDRLVADRALGTFVERRDVGLLELVSVLIPLWHDLLVALQMHDH